MLHPLGLALSLLLLGGCDASGPRPRHRVDAGTPTAKHTDAGPRQLAPHAAAHKPYRAPPPRPERIRFIALGDGGTGDANQFKVAHAAREVCTRLGCEFALYLGDNIYNVGVNGADDPQFESKFEEPYAELDMPFFVVLGNHDYGGEVPLVTGVGAAQKSDAEIEYTAHSHKWTMPDAYFTFERGPVAFFALDTNAFIYDLMGGAAEQQTWLDRELARSQAPWKIVFGHHPYISNGYHGSAGNFDGQGDSLPEVNAADGAGFAALVEHSVCGHAQVYLAGHDHDREWLEPTCGTTFIVSGAAAKLRAMYNRDDEKTRFQDGSKHGFLWVEVDEQTLTGIFFDEDGKISYQDTVVRKSAP